MKRMIAVRRLSQAVFLILFLYILWSTAYPLTGLLKPDILFKADPLIMIITSVSERVVLPGIIFSVCMLVLSVILGRFFCGWVCPLGTAIDMTGALSRKKRGVSDKANAIIRKIKFYILGVIFIFALLGRQIAWIFDPIVTIGRFVSLNLIPAVTFAINSFFIFLIKYLNLGGPVKDVYRALKPTVLGVKTYYFTHAAAIFMFFAVILLASLVISRFWCRALCPLGAIYALLAKAAPLKRVVEKCTSCRYCKSRCRTGAIRDDISYAPGECVLCMDCVYDCPAHITRFKFVLPVKTKKEILPKGDSSGVAMSRKNFLLLLFGLIPLLGAKFAGGKEDGSGQVIRPPAALEEDDFLNRCVRCGNCMKVCPTNALHPVMLQAGLEGIWTPQLIPEIGYCEYRCTLCGRTCPTGAIHPLDLERKLVVKLGLAEVDKSICLPWAEGKECIVCQEHCPVAEKAIKLDTYGGGPAKPYVDPYLCVGCGICQNKCPVRPSRAIRVSPKNADRFKA